MNKQNPLQAVMQNVSGDGWLAGVRFGMASAVLSAVVLVLSLRPLHRFRIALVASLLTIALVDSMADGYALFNAVEDLGTAAASITAKLTVCGSLAVLAFFAGRSGPGQTLKPTAGSKRAQVMLYALTAAFVVGQFALTMLTVEAKDDRWSEAGLLVLLFVAAVGLSLVLNRLVAKLETNSSIATR
jgi:hypothetical protein